MLYRFLIDNRDAILAEVEEKSAEVAKDKATSAKSSLCISQFYDHLVYELKRESNGLAKSGDGSSARKHGLSATAEHGRELSRLGYTVSQVVHAYGALCQVITTLASAKQEPISASEFSVLNLSLDDAIAAAVTGFAEKSTAEGADSTKRTGFLVHELRNALAAAIVAHSMVKKGVVGTGGSTNALLERNLNRMRDLLDRSFSEVRMQNEKGAERETLSVIEIIDEVEATASEQARVRDLRLVVEAEPDLEVLGDRNYLISALSNLVQNAIKYSKPGGTIWIRSRGTENEALLEVEDRCGGLPKGRADELFKPFTQKGSDRSGLGLGLSISRRAVDLSGGSLSVRDLPGRGCIFAIALPKQKNARAPKRPAAA